MVVALIAEGEVDAGEAEVTDVHHVCLEEKKLEPTISTVGSTTQSEWANINGNTKCC